MRKQSSLKTNLNLNNLRAIKRLADPENQKIFNEIIEQANVERGARWLQDLTKEWPMLSQFAVMDAALIVAFLAPFVPKVKQDQKGAIQLVRQIQAKMRGEEERPPQKNKKRLSPAEK